MMEKNEANLLSLVLVTFVGLGHLWHQGHAIHAIITHSRLLIHTPPSFPSILIC